MTNPDSATSPYTLECVSDDHVFATNDPTDGGIQSIEVECADGVWSVVDGGPQLLGSSSALIEAPPACVGEYIMRLLS